MTTKTTVLKPGEQIHFLEAGVSFAVNGSPSGGRTSVRGMTVTITDALLEVSRDRFNSSWLDLVDDPDAQCARWGRETFRRGPAPEDMHPWHRGEPAWAEAREEARKAAWTLPTDGARREALAAVEAHYGAGPTTSTFAGEPVT